MLYCAYLRKSRADLEAEVHGEGETLARHEHMLNDAAKRLNLSISTYYREIVSGESISARPMMQKLLREVENGLWSGVFVVEVERLARGDTVDQGFVSRAFSCSGTKIITPLKTYDPNNEFDEEYFEFGLFMSRREYKTIRRRMQAGCQAAAQEGKFAAKTAPYGYRKIKLNSEKGWTLDIQSEEAAIVQEIFRQYLDGVGYQHIAAVLTKRGIASPRSQTWSAYTIRHILQNATYCGKIRWGQRPVKKNVQNGVLYKSRPHSSAFLETDGRHPAIISPEDFDAAQQRRSQTRSAPVALQKQLQNPFRKILYCSQCGHAMQLHPYPALHTASLECRTVGCSTVSVRLPVVEHAVREVLQNLLGSHTITITPLESQQLPMETCQTQLQHLQKEQSTLTQQLDHACEFLEQGIYTPKQFLSRQTTLQQQLSTLETQRSELEDELAQLNACAYAFSPYSTHMINAWDCADISQKNALLHALFARIEYSRTLRTGPVNLTFSPRFLPLSEVEQQ